VLWFLASHLLTVRTPLGRKLKPRVLANGSPRIRVKSKDLEQAGVLLAPKTTEVRDGRPVFADGRILDVANVIWATGFRQDYSWIDIPGFESDGAPMHERGVATEPGLYFVGLDFMYAATSENVGGVGRDARHVARHIARLSSSRDS
jgi:putative flavoprotein involved in K+ transport